MVERVPFTSLLSAIVDNRGRTCPTADEGLPLIATNCVKNSTLNPLFDKVRFVDQNTYENWFRGHPKPGDMIFVCKGAPGQVCLAPDPVNFCIAQDMVALRANPDRVYPLYLFAALRSKEVQRDIKSMHVGTMIPHFKKGDFGKLSIPLPPEEHQRFIGDWHLAIERKIELNRRTGETLEAMAQAIFRDWFVDFGPVRRKLAGATDPIEIMGGLSPESGRAAELAALFPLRLGEGDLPAGWRVSTVGEAFSLTMGQSPPGETYNEVEDGLPFYQGRTDFGFRFPERRKFCSQPTRIARPDDTLISVRAPVGDLNVAWEECCIGRGVAAARHRSGAKSYTFCAMRSLQPELELFENSGTVFGAINKKQFDRLTIIEPDPAVVAAFEALAGPLDDRLRAGVDESRTLAGVRDYLLSRLMSGEVRVASAAQEIAA